MIFILSIYMKVHLAERHELQMTEGKPIENIETLAASILSTTPMFTDEKMKLTRTFIQTYRGHATWGS